MGRRAWRAAAALLALAASVKALCPNTGGGGTEVELIWDATTVATQTTQVIWSPVNPDHAFIVNQAGIVYARSRSDPLLQTTVIDIQAQVYSWHDRGLVSIAFHPSYATNHFVYLFYGNQPSPPWADDSCVITGGANDARNYCMSNGVLQRFTIAPIMDGTDVVGYEEGVAGPILIEDWCDSSMTHHLGTIAFLPDNSLLVTSGDGSQALDALDTGYSYDQCTRPNFGNKPQGSFKSQQMEFLHGKMLRIEGPALVRATGGLTLGEDYFIIAKGLRNPFRFTVHPVSGDVYIGDVGSSGTMAKEEINHLVNPAGATELLANFGWPCMEGNAAKVDVQEWLLANPTMSDVGCKAVWSGTDKLYTPPVYTYRNTDDQPFDPENADACEPNGSVDQGAITGLDVYETGPLEGLLGGKLVFCDYAKMCVVYFDNVAGTGEPDFTSAHVLTEGALYDSVQYGGPDGLLYMTSWSGPTGVFEVQSASNLVVPVTNLETDPSPADVAAGGIIKFDASGTKNGDGTAIVSYSWDFDGDGVEDMETTVPTAEYKYEKAGVYTASVTATSAVATSDCQNLDVLVGVTTAITMTPPSGEWKVGDYIDFSLKITGAKVDPASVKWTQATKHCYMDRCLGEAQCHDHSDALLGGNTGLTGLRIKPIAHEMPSYVEVTAYIPLGGKVIARAFDTTATTYSWVLRTVPPGFKVYSGESGLVCSYSNPPCEVPVMAANSLAITVARVQALDDNIYAFTRYAMTQSGETTNSTESQATPVAAADGEVVAYFEKVAVTKSTTMSAPTNFAINRTGFEELTATWDKVEGAEYYVVYLHTTTDDGLANIPASSYPTATAVSGSESSVMLSVPDGTVDYIASVAAYMHSTTTLGPRSAAVKIRTEPSDGVCISADPECTYPDADPCTAGIPAGVRAMGLGGFFDDRCAVSGSLPGCYNGLSGCRACYWDRCLWSAENSGRDPGYVPDCPPCVATGYKLTKGDQNCGFASSDGVDPNAAEDDAPAPAPAPAKEGTRTYQVQMRSCLVGAASGDYSAGNSNGEGGSDAVTIFQKQMELEFGYVAFTSATGSCDKNTFSRRRLHATAAAGSRQLADATSGAEVTYSLVDIESTDRADVVAKAVIDGSLDGSLALQLALGGLTDVTMVVTSTEYTVSTYDKGSDDSKLGTGGIVAIAVVAAAACALLAAGVFVTRRRKAKKTAAAAAAKQEPPVVVAAPAEPTTNPMTGDRK